MIVWKDFSTFWRPVISLKNGIMKISFVFGVLGRVLSGKVGVFGGLGGLFCGFLF